ncbi:hypothetical protein KDA23_06095, partial [Candidatus Saccharibacteria bacterium]|nr:hypothetical protein [Candidatus Saccharibacteria bacterium]
NLRLTPAQKRNLGKKLDDVTDYLSEKKIVGTPEARFNKVSKIYNGFEDQLQGFLKEQDDLGTFVPRQKLVDDLEGLKAQYVNHRDSIAIDRQIDNAITTLKKNYQDEAKLTGLNEFKRSTYNSAYNAAGDKVNDAVEHEIADVVRQNIVDAIPEGATINGKSYLEFNEEYGKAIQARRLLDIARSRKQVGFLGKLVSIAVGSGIGTSAGGVVGAAAGAGIGPVVAEQVAGSATRSAVGATSQLVSELLKPEVLETFGRALIPVIRRELQKEQQRQ